MSRVLILAALLGLAGVGVSASALTLGTFAVDPQSTFLYETSNDSNVGALFINLTCPPSVTANCVTVSAGTTLQIIGLGSLCFFTGTCAEIPENIGGVFDSNNTLLPSSSLVAGSVNRLTGTISAGASTALVNHNPFLNTYFGGIDTTIANDFFIPTGDGITVVVPNGAAYLVVGVLDSYFADNSDPSHTLAVQINEIIQNPLAPEPGTLGLLIAGIAFVAAARFRRSN